MSIAPAFKQRPTVNSTKRRRSIAETLRNLALSLLCVLAAISLGAWGYGLLFPDSVDRLAIEFEKRRPAHLRALFFEANLTYRSDPHNGIRLFQGILAELEGVRSRDAVAYMKVRVFDKLSKATLATGQLDLGISTARKWVEFDPRDLNAGLRLSALLAHSENGAAESQKIASEIYTLVPEMDAAASRYSLSLLATDDAVGFWRVQLENSSRKKQLLNNLSRQSWTVFWDDGSGFSAAQSQSVKPVISDGQNLTILTVLPAGTTSVRLDPPPNVRFVLRDPRMELLSARGADSQLDIAHNSFRSRKMTQSGRYLLTGTARSENAPIPARDGSGIWTDGPTLVEATNDPFFWWSITPNENETRVLFQAEILDIGEFLVSKLLESGDPARLELALRDKGFHPAADVLSTLFVPNASAQPTHVKIDPLR